VLGAGVGPSWMPANQGFRGKITLISMLKSMFSGVKRAVQCKIDILMQNLIFTNPEIQKQAFIINVLNHIMKTWKCAGKSVMNGNMDFGDPM
jgi:hypothetical protein